MRRNDTRAAVGVALLLTLTTGVAVLGVPAALADPRDAAQEVDRASYGAGWGYVVGRQPGAARDGSWLGSDTAIRQACHAYAEGFARLDRIADPASFRAGCDDAARETRLERP